jgi:hypothetical protein
MTSRFLFASFAAACMLAACGGDAPPQGAASPRLLAASAATSAAAPDFPGRRADYAITPTADGYVVTPLTGSGTTTVPRNARLRFADISVAFDLDGNAGRAFRLYRAAFDRTPDAPGIGYWIGQLDQGLDPALVAGAFMESDEFKSRYGTGLTDADYIGKLYFNVLHRDIDPAGRAFWTSLMERGAVTRAQVLAAFSEGAEAKSMASGAIRGGIYFIEDGVAYLPAADAGPKRIVDLGRRVTLDGGGSTVANGKSILYYWTFGKKPPASAAVLDDAGTAHPSFVPDVEGEYEVKLVVSDGTDYSREASSSLQAAWAPDAASLPASGNLVYLDSEEGDPIGKGMTSTYTQANAVLSVTADRARLNVTVQGDASWSGNVALPYSAGKLVPGYFGGLNSNTYYDYGGVSWSLSGASTNCKDAASSWIVVDRAIYVGNTLTAVDLRFSQRCLNGFGVLHGRVRWSADDSTAPPGPVDPAPAGLWQPAADATPASGSYLYLESAAGEQIGGGLRYTYTKSSGLLTVSGQGTQVSMHGGSYSGFYGDLVGMNSLSRLVPGYYGKLQSYPFNNPTRAGLRWNMGGGYNSSSCTTSGWFVVDHVVYVGNDLTELDLRFEQVCIGNPAPLNGKLHWRASGN